MIRGPISRGIRIYFLFLSESSQFEGQLLAPPLGFTQGIRGLQIGTGIIFNKKYSEIYGILTFHHFVEIRALEILIAAYSYKSKTVNEKFANYYFSKTLVKIQLKKSYLNIKNYSFIKIWMSKLHSKSPPYAPLKLRKFFYIFKSHHYSILNP